MQKLFISILVVSLLMLFGCMNKKQNACTIDSVTYVLMDHIQSRKATIEKDVKRRAELALSEWRNGMHDPKPILIFAALNKKSDNNTINMTLSIFDEDGDVIGFIVKEDYYDINNTVSTLEERYPVYFHCIPMAIADLHWLKVSIRTNHQRKDEAVWKNYTNWDYKKDLDEYLKKNDELGTPKLPEEFWGETLPAVWVSLPEPNKVFVSISLYDQEGNESEPVKLIDISQRNNKN